MKVKALGMLSGGLDSSLAAKIVQNLGIEFEGIHFSTGFCVVEHSRNFKDKAPRPHEALRLAGDLGFQLHIVDVSKDYLPVVTNPKYGYGANMNPCIDCRVFMFKRMKALMAEYGAQFIFTGEVLGQRPKSQFREALKIIERDSGLEGLVLRPLSAQLLDPTVAEVKGWVDRTKLLALSGRSRKPQIEEAKRLNWEGLPQPAGGCCYLADPRYSDRLRDFFKVEGKKALTHEQVLLLKVGRHFRTGSGLKVIVGRNERENRFLEPFAKERHAFRTPDFPCAFVLADTSRELTREEVLEIVELSAHYSDAPKTESVRVERRFGAEEEILMSAALEREFQSI